jgi:hypothetical protein
MIYDWPCHPRAESEQPAQQLEQSALLAAVRVLFCLYEICLAGLCVFYWYPTVPRISTFCLQNKHSTL